EEIAIRCTKLQPPQLSGAACDDFDQTAQAYTEELRIRSQVLPPHHPSVLATQLHLLSIYSVRGDISEHAAAIVQQALAAVSALEEADNAAPNLRWSQQKAVIELHWANYRVQQGRHEQALGSAYGAMGAFAELAQ